MSGLHAAEMPVCLALNRWGAHNVVHGFFATISRLGDGVFWYAALLALAISGGARGMLAAAHMALTGLATLALYRAMKRRIRRPRPADAGAGVVARIAPLHQFSFPSGHALHAVAFTIVGCFWFPSGGERANFPFPLR